MKKFDNKVMVIFLIVLINVLGMTIMLPLLPFYSEKFGATPFVFGLLVSAYAYAIAQLVSGPILGDLSDRFGRRPVLIISQIGTLIGFLLLAFSNSLFWIFVSRIIGVNQSLQSIVQIVAPMISTAVIEKNYLSYWAIVSMLFSILGLVFSVNKGKKLSLKQENI